MASPQSLENHARLDPPVHFFLFPVAAATFIWMIVNLVKSPDIPHAALVVLAAAGLVGAFKIRLYALKVQDRVIRLEERLRLATILPERLRGSIGDLTESQLVALRFASDSELAGLVEKALSSNLKNSDIKKEIKTWRPDYFRV
jgi:hypothetical protein